MANGICSCRGLKAKWPPLLRATNFPSPSHAHEVQSRTLGPTRGLENHLESFLLICQYCGFLLPIAEKTQNLAKTLRPRPALYPSALTHKSLSKVLTSQVRLHRSIVYLKAGEQL